MTLQYGAEAGREPLRLGVKRCPISVRDMSWRREPAVHANDQGGARRRVQDLQQTIHTLSMEDGSHVAAEEDHHMSDLLENEELLSALYAGFAVRFAHSDP